SVTNVGTVFFRTFGPARNNQSIGRIFLEQFSKCLHEKFQALVRCNVSEEKKRLVSCADTQSLARFSFSDVRDWHCVVDTKWDDGDFRVRHVELGEEFIFHLFRVDENVIGKPILAPKGDAVPNRVIAIALAGIDVVSSENQTFAEEFVKTHHQRAIEK